MSRILVVGCSGAGKSTLARQLGARLHLPVVHLDRHYWNAGWRPTPDTEFDVHLETLLAEPTWVMDGNYVRTLARRLRVADVAVFLDFSPWVCRTRVIRRTVRWFGRARPDLAPGCREQIDGEFLRWVWNFHRDVLPEVKRILRAAPPSVRVLTATSPRELEALMGSERALGGASLAGAARGTG
ncbi:MAG: AAA family ATPase [Gemmatimonadetes bacterium]|nr:AAA family ATPase [Gemmatimonadota bacterium]